MSLIHGFLAMMRARKEKQFQERVANEQKEAEARLRVLAPYAERLIEQEKLKGMRN
jgi:hypothetical protein